jgi:lysophospholipase-2
VKLENIIIGGFSQGCIVSLATALHLKDRLEGPIGGIIGLSGICPIKEPDNKGSMLERIPMFIYIGSEDNFFDQKVAELTYKVFEGCNVKYTCEPGLQHSLS